MEILFNFSQSLEHLKLGIVLKKGGEKGKFSVSLFFFLLVQEIGIRIVDVGFLSLHQKRRSSSVSSAEGKERIKEKNKNKIGFPMSVEN